MTRKAARCWQVFMHGLDRLEEVMLSLLLLAMILLTCTQILLRDLFSSGFVWADPLLRYLVIWAGLFGADQATKKAKHINIDLLSYLLPARLQSWLRVLLHLFAACVCLCLCYAAILFIRNEAALSDNGQVLPIPSWVMNLAFPIAFALISLRFLIHLAQDLAALASPDQPPGPGTA